MISITVAGALALASLLQVTFAHPHGPGTDFNCTMEFQNEITEPLYLECDSGYALTGVETCYEPVPGSKRFARNYDRKWKWHCRPVSLFRKESCVWQLFSGATLPILDQCPPNHYMAGIHSYYFSSDSDRIWSIKCCELEDWCHRDCYLTEYYVNEFGEDFYYFTDNYEKELFVGIFSEFDTGYQDRRWKFEICKFSLCDFDVIIDRKD